MTENELIAQVEALNAAATKSIDSCLTAKAIALSDARVRTLFLKKVADGYDFKKIDCLDRVQIPENKSVLFDFDCKPGTICLIRPAFLVVVNIVDGYVVAIVDPYIPPSEPLMKGNNTVPILLGPGGVPILGFGRGATVARADLGVEVRIEDVEVGGGELRFRLIGVVKYGGDEAEFLNSTFRLNGEQLCEERPEFRNRLFVVKNQKVCLIFAEAKVEFCCTARFRPIPQTETDFCIKFDVPLP